jgi:hypothetical protein
MSIHGVFRIAENRVRRIASTARAGFHPFRGDNCSRDRKVNEYHYDVSQ